MSAYKHTRVSVRSNSQSHHSLMSYILIIGIRNQSKSTMLPRLDQSAAEDDGCCWDPFHMEIGLSFHIHSCKKSRKGEKKKKKIRRHKLNCIFVLYENGNEHWLIIIIIITIIMTFFFFTVLFEIVGGKHYSTSY